MRERGKWRVKPVWEREESESCGRGKWKWRLKVKHAWELRKWKWKREESENWISRHFFIHFIFIFLMFNEWEEREEKRQDRKSFLSSFSRPSRYLIALYNKYPAAHDAYIKVVILQQFRIVFEVSNEFGQCSTHELAFEAQSIPNENSGCELKISHIC